MVPSPRLPTPTLTTYTLGETPLRYLAYPRPILESSHYARVEGAKGSSHSHHPTIQLDQKEATVEGFPTHITDDRLLREVINPEFVLLCSRKLSPVNYTPCR